MIIFIFSRLFSSLIAVMYTCVTAITSVFYRFSVADDAVQLSHQVIEGAKGNRQSLDDRLKKENKSEPVASKDCARFHQGKLKKQNQIRKG